MAPPAVKRRKLSHDSSQESSDDEQQSLASNGQPEATSDDAGDTGPDSDIEMEGAGGQSSLAEEDGSDNEDESHGDIAQENGKNGLTGAQKETQRRAQRNRSTVAEGGVYTGEIYKSNLFKLQVDDILAQIRPRHGAKEAAAEKALRTLKTIIDNIPTREALSIPDAERSLIKQHKVAIPFPNPRPPKDAKYTLQYSKPVLVNPIGSYPLKMNVRTRDEMSIDLVVIMPPNIFQEKDYLNYRYFYKRAYYLACIAAGIKSSEEHNFKLSFGHLNGNELQPILVVRGGDPADAFTTSRYQINIIPAAADGVFPDEKTLPEKNCLRPKQTEEGSTAAKLKPTPFYNASLRTDSQYMSYLKLMHSAMGQSEAYKDACLLGSTWLRQRGFGSHIVKGGFGNFEWAAIVALLLQGNGPAGKPLFAKGYSSYQLVKGMLQFLASKDLVQQPQLHQASGISIPKEDSVPTFFDGPRGLNLLYKMSPWSYKLLRREARTTVASLGESAFDQFQSTFVLRADPPMHRYDLLLNLPISSLGISSGDESHRQKLSDACHKLYRVLNRGSGDRVSLVSISMPPEQPWQLGSTRSLPARDDILQIGFILDPANVSRAVDHGPSAESKKEAALFRQFWGEKAELRRFKDGSILESIVWSAKDSDRTIFEQIVLYLLSRHFSKDVHDQATFFGEDFARLLSGSGQVGSDLFLPARKAFDTLERDIRALEGMPLTTRHVFAADPQLRYASVDVPLTLTRKQMSEPANVVMEFEGSGRWPDDLKAIQMTKVAFLLKLGELLQDSVESLIARVGLENEDQDVMNKSFLDVIYPSGAAFRIRIHHDREQTLIERRLKDKNLEPATREASALALAVFKRDFIRVPSHTQAIQALCTRLPALSPTIRLLKKWFANHLLSAHFAPELIEIIAVRTFLQSYPWEPPSSPMTGFLRTLSFLSRWDWRNEPLVVDFNNSMKEEDLAAITTRYEAWRKIDPALNRVSIFAATSIDPEGTTWTDHARPAKVVAGRMSALAKAASEAVKDQGIKIEPESLFVSPLGDYDFVIHLQQRYTRAGQSKKDRTSGKAQFKNLVLQTDAAEEASMVGFNPVKMYLAELNDVYGHVITFFYEEGGDVIAGLWNPANTTRRKWKVRLGYSTSPVGVKGEEAENVEVDANKEGMMGEMSRLGGEMVRKVEVNRR
ncbi:Nrap protein [Saccharata proteae CBS 121410]|uniref:U3 small nucleolar RNA-associated protein 22 n=1 Tax=Saccharata proteae CBS 121410 TaxID=1314787 RepID=A0A9P4HQZ9_9PEZI|nr:Nrap protein [Saccharata proteae CBS 121410]